MKNLYFFILILLFFISFCKAQDYWSCPCYGNEDKEKQGYSCSPIYVPDKVDFALNGYSGERYLGQILNFRQYNPISIEDSFLSCFVSFYDGEWPLHEKIFSEARIYFIPFLEKNIKDNILYSTALTISEDGKYIIPYCYGIEKLFIYKINSLFVFKGNPFPSFEPAELYKEIKIGEAVEAVKFFENYLIVITKSKIIAFNSRGPKKFKKVGEFPYPHNLYEVPPDSFCNSNCVMPMQKFSIEMDGDYLYILNSPGNDYGPVLTFKVGEEGIKMIDDGRVLPKEEGVWVVRGNVQANEVYGKKYLTYIEGIWASYQYYGYAYLYLYRLEEGKPVFIRKYEIDELSYEWFFAYSFKDEDLYMRFSEIDQPCVSFVCKFNLEETFSCYSEVGEAAIFKNSDTMVNSYIGVHLSCGTDDLPVVEEIIYPKEGAEVAGNFLIMGKAYDSEGIRRAAYLSSNPGEMFPQEDGSIIFLIKAYIPDWWPDYKENAFVILEDKDGDTNYHFNEDVIKEFPEIYIKQSATNPLPFGEVEEYPFKYSDKKIRFKGWALDNSGIEKGWLLSEEANILVEINYGEEREDIKEKYPEYPDSLHSGFEVSYDSSNLEEGEYEFIIRIMAKDYQVLDFGPYKISIPKHKRPF